jgi:hypothetical protein
MEGSNTPSTIWYTHSPPLMRRTSASCIAHTSAILEDHRHLLPFPVCAALPRAEYYGSSVALRVAPCRPSHIPATRDDKRDVGAWFAPLSEVIPHRSPHGRFESRRFGLPIVVTPPWTRLSGDVRFHRWKLRFNQWRLRPIAQVLQSPTIRVFWSSSRSSHALVPFCFRS